MNCLGPLRNRAGVTLLEVLVALLLLALLAGSLIKIAAVSGHWVKEAERQAQAAVLALNFGPNAGPTRVWRHRPS